MVFKRKRSARAAVALTLTAALAATGCSTGWQAVREDWTPIRTSSNVHLNSIRNSNKIREFDIQAQVLRGTYFTKIDEKAGTEIVNEDSFGDNVHYKKMVYEKNETKMPIFTALGTAGGLALGASLGKKEKEDSNALNAIGLGLGGFIAGLLIDANSSGLNIKDVRARETGETKIETENVRTEKTTLGKSLKNIPAAAIKVQLDGVTYTTDSQGMVNLSDIVESKNPNYFCRESNFSGAGMENRLKAMPLIQQIKSKTLETLMKKLAGEMDYININIRAETKEAAGYSETVKNDAKMINLKGYKLSNDDIYKVVREFVETDINSHIVQARFDIRDLITRRPISDATFTYEIEGEKKEDLAEKYFTGSLKDYARGYIKDYLDGSGWFNIGSSVTLSLYNPSKIKVQFTNPDYRFVEGTVTIDKDGIKKIVYMADKGSKVRVEPSKDGNGGME